MVNQQKNQNYKYGRMIRVKYNTYQKLISLGKYSDSMDGIISKILEQLDNSHGMEMPIQQQK